MSTSMSVPSTIPGGAKVYFPDGTSAVVGADGMVTVPNNYQANMLNAGFGAIRSTSALAPFGYGVGAGGSVAQLTSKATGVTLNKPVGQITTFGDALAGGAEVSFTVTDSAVAAADIIVASIVSGGTASAYGLSITAVAAGSFVITITNLTGGSLSEALVINFVVIKGAVT